MVAIVSPEGVRANLDRSLADRPDSLEGLVVGLLDNNKPGATQILAGILRGLEKHGITGSVYRRKSHPSAPSPYVAQVAQEAQIAVSAVGD